eukprot:NODE_8877_length_391_cov_29.543860_g7989_i0.p2 GENE.NODE_8877_length_391_cov_29.543860_g7989_i0~~NODE_8877_length_391_cov_29.543860_g7989_i0.p2  ORF type:complete len:58 (+),score=10.56 NODE_8877_length_391_cov_29.543860_g7989_i0:139-312(+)
MYTQTHIIHIDVTAMNVNQKAIFLLSAAWLLFLVLLKTYWQMIAAEMMKRMRKMREP